MKRITVEEVKEAYAKTGLIPVCGTYLQVDGDSNYCGCAAFAVACMRNPDVFERAKDSYALDASENTAGKGESIGMMIDEEFGSDYTTGFTRGFDGWPTGRYDGEPVVCGEGYADGKAAREAIIIPNA